MMKRNAALRLAADLLESYVIEDNQPHRREACERAILIIRDIIGNERVGRLSDAEA
jgi:hypothetical protein